MRLELNAENYSGFYAALGALSLWDPSRVTGALARAKIILP